MLGCTLTLPEGPSEEPMDITAMVGVAGRLCGVISVQCGTKSSTIMAAHMLGVEPAQIGPEMCDAFGEICNMIAGNFKNKIAGLADGCMLSVPTVVTGSDYSFHSLADSPTLQVRFLFEGKPVIISSADSQLDHLPRADTVVESSTTADSSKAETLPVTDLA